MVRLNNYYSNGLVMHVSSKQHLTSNFHKKQHTPNKNCAAAWCRWRDWKYLFCVFLRGVQHCPYRCSLKLHHLNIAATLGPENTAIWRRCLITVLFFIKWYPTFVLKLYKLNKDKILVYKIWLSTLKTNKKAFFRT